MCGGAGRALPSNPIFPPPLSSSPAPHKIPLPAVPPLPPTCSMEARGCSPFPPTRRAPPGPPHTSGPFAAGTHGDPPRRPPDRAEPRCLGAAGPGPLLHGRPFYGAAGTGGALGWWGEPRSHPKALLSRSAPAPRRPALPPLCAPYHRRGPAVATRRSTRWAPGDARGAQNAAAGGSGDPPGARIRPSGTLPIVSRSPRALLAPSIPDNTVGGPEGSASPRPRPTANRPNSEAERDGNPTAPGEEGSAAYRCLHPPSGLGSPAAPALRSRSPRALLSSR